MKRLLEVQSRLKVPKDQFNEFGEYNFRSCEGIVEAVKPLLAERGLLLLMKDDIEHVGERYYVKATVSVRDESKEIASVSACARETEHRTKMDDAQLTGAASSYARKYALCGLFAIDDGQDPDSLKREAEKKEKEVQEPAKKVSKCPKCGRMAAAAAIETWGMCSTCKTKQVKESKNDK